MERRGVGGVEKWVLGGKRGKCAKAATVRGGLFSQQGGVFQVGMGGVSG
jgi:hypothetical protein